MSANALGDSRESPWRSSQISPFAKRTPALQRLQVAPSELETPEVASPYDGLEDSDVFECPPETRAIAATKAREVTLFVHQWHNVEPGLLSWTFPNLRAALDSVQRMKNAIGWCVVSGTGWTDLDVARKSGAILVEQLT